MRTRYVPNRALISPAAVKMPAVVANRAGPPCRIHITRISTALPPRIAYTSFAVTGQLRGTGTRRFLRPGAAARALLWVVYVLFIEWSRLPGLAARGGRRPMTLRYRSPSPSYRATRH